MPMARRVKQKDGDQAVPIDPNRIAATLDNFFSSDTRAAVDGRRSQAASGFAAGQSRNDAAVIHLSQRERPIPLVCKT